MLKKIFSLSFLLTSMLQAMPTQQKISLELPKNINIQSEEHKEIAKALLSLQLYEDSKDKNIVYYLPPFRPYVFDQGSAGGLRNMRLVEHFDDCLEILNNLKNENYKNLPWIKERVTSLKESLQEDIDYIKSNILDAKSRIKYLQEKRFDFMLTGNQEAINYIDKLIEEKKFELKEKEIQLSKKYEELYIKTQEFEKEHIISQIDLAAMYLRMAGGKFELKTYNNTAELIEAFSDSLASADNSYVGFFSMSVYAGFTQEQLETLSKYKMLVPDKKIILMPATDFNFTALTDTAKENNQVKSVKMFGDAKGAGDYTGANITFDLTVAGARALGMYLEPFIVPIAINAATNFQMEPFEAVLKCDFSSGYSVKGRSDIKDGLVIFDNDLTNQIKTHDQSSGACNVEMISGDRKSAHLTALQELEKVYEGMRVRRITLSEQQKNQYYTGILSDLSNKQHEERKDDSSSIALISAYANLGLEGMLVQALSQASNFYWHTRIEDVENLSTVKFEKRIKLQGHETLRQYWPTNICLYYNSSKKAYDRCTKNGEHQAQSVIEASDKALNSSSCAKEDKSLECGKKRKLDLEQQPILPEEPTKKDDYLL